uniref:Uncharacterized protein n=1 Tax=Meloidogyne javanica TaxID=6303 RepID=A0A915MNH2_MELJA
FINPRHVDVDCYDDEEDTEKGKQRGRQRSSRERDGFENGYLQRITLILVCIYLSILSVVPFPLIVVTVTIFAAMNRKGDEITTLWFCAIASGFGAFGKLVAIIVFSSIFGFTKGVEVENRRRGGMQSVPHTQEDRNEKFKIRVRDSNEHSETRM